MKEFLIPPAPNRFKHQLGIWAVDLWSKWPIFGWSQTISTSLEMTSSAKVANTKLQVTQHAWEISVHYAGMNCVCCHLRIGCQRTCRLAGDLQVVRTNTSQNASSRQGSGWTSTETNTYQILSNSEICKQFSRKIQSMTEACWNQLNQHPQASFKWICGNLQRSESTSPYASYPYHQNPIPSQLNWIGLQISILFECKLKKRSPFHRTRLWALS